MKLHLLATWHPCNPQWIAKQLYELVKPIKTSIVAYNHNIASWYGTTENRTKPTNVLNGYVLSLTLEPETPSSIIFNTDTVFNKICYKSKD